jgi:acetate kinase
MQILEALAANDEAAEFAIEQFCYLLRKQIAAMAAALDGLDLLVFTGGIGENDASVRDKICQGLDWIGAFAVAVMPAGEEEQMAFHAAELLWRTYPSK